MKVKVFETKEELGKSAAEYGANLINEAISKRGKANIIVATGASQFEMLDNLIREKIDWNKVSAFHLDEYIGLSFDHPASFRKYLKERFVSKVPLKEFFYINGEVDVAGECDRLNRIIVQYPIDVAFVGIGENGHLAFNDPPADFEIDDPYIQVDLDKECRMQQFGEGWFNDIDEVPKRAISMTVKQILKSENIICSVPDKRKARAVKNVVDGEVRPEVPASILQTHGKTTLYLDAGSNSLR
jgi:glucosamine-6-phosphate deaminase